MMNPDTGTMRMIDKEEMEALTRREKQDNALRTMEPHEVMWSEGMEVEVRGCWFRVDAVRRTRVTLTPIPRPR
jgi:hypothetical protein